MMEANICYALIFLAEAAVAWLYFEYLYIPKTKLQIQIASFGIAYSILFFCFFIDSLAINALAMCIANAILARMNYRCAIKTAILHGAFLEFMIVGTELLTNLLIVALGEDFSAYTYDLSVLIAMAIISKLLYLVVTLIGARFFKPQNASGEEPRLMFVFCGLPLFSIILAVLIIRIGLSYETTKASGIMMVFTMFVLLIMNLVFMILYNYLQKVHNEQLTLQLSLQKEQADMVYYKALQEQFDNQRILVHDIKNHLSTINDLSTSGKAGEIGSYIASLSDSLKPSQYAKLCTDPILNMMLLRYRDNCREHGIDFQCDVRDNTTSFMDAPSITTLYGNLLSNAFEAAIKSKEKSVELSVTRNLDQSIIVISVINSCDSISSSDANGYFLTTKQNRSGHGIGLRSIKRIVKKHNGVSTMYFDENTHKFHHIIQFPFSSNSVEAVSMDRS